MSLSTDQYSRLRYLQQVRQQRAQEKDAAKKQAEENGEQYRPSRDKANTKEVLNNWWVTTENKQEHLADLYNRMKYMQDSGRDVNWIYDSIWYDTMGNDEKNIVDWMLGWYQVDNDTLF